MKRIFALVLVLVLALTACVACTKNNDNNDNNDNNNEKTYTVAIATDSAFGKGGKVTNIGLVLVIDADGKIAAARFDSAEPKAALDENGSVVAVESVTSKVELGDEYTGISASWKAEAKAFEDFLVGKTAADVAALAFVTEDGKDAGLVAGCTMKSSMPTFQTLVAKAFASTSKVSFTASSFTVGIAIDSFVGKNRSGGADVTSDIAGVVLVDGKVAACVLDSVVQSYSIVEGALVAGELAVSKTEQGDGYKMPAGNWTKQAAAFAASTVGKTVADLANLETVSDALAAAGCTMKNTTAGYKATIISAAEYAR